MRSLPRGTRPLRGCLLLSTSKRLRTSTDRPPLGTTGRFILDIIDHFVSEYIIVPVGLLEARPCSARPCPREYLVG